MRLLERQLDVEAKLDFGLDVAQRHHLVAQRHAIALVRRDIVVVAPLVDAHLLADDIDHRQWPLVDVEAGTEAVDRKRGLVAMRYRPDDVLRAERRITAEEDFGIARGHRFRVDLGHVPLVELDADVALDPGKRVLLADRDQHVVAWNMLVGLAAGHQVAPALGVVLGLHLLEYDAGELAIVVGEFLRHQEIEDRDVLVHGVLLLPGGRLHLLEAGAHDDLDVLAAETARGAAAIHGGVAAAEHDDALADLVDVAKRDGGEPVDADVNVGGGFLAAGNLKLASARRARANEDCVPAFRQQRLEAVDALAAHEFDAEPEDIIALLVDDALRQTEARDLGADHAARLRILVEHHAAVAERCEIARDRQRGGAAAYERNALAVGYRRSLRQATADVVLVVGGDPLEAADRNRILLDATAPAGRLARPVTGAPKHAGEHIGSPVDHVGVAVATSRDQSNVFRNGGVCWTGPLAIHDLVEVVRRPNVSILHLLRLVHVPRLLREFRFVRGQVFGRFHWRFGSWGPIPGRNVVDQFGEFHRYD